MIVLTQKDKNRRIIIIVSLILVTVIFVGALILLNNRNNNFSSEDSKASEPVSTNLPKITLAILEEKEIKVNVTEHTWLPELTPQFVKQANGKYAYVMGGTSSFKCITDQNILSGNVSIPVADCNTITLSSVTQKLLDNGESVFFPPNGIRNDNWNFSYNGVINFTIAKGSNASKVVAVMHNESQNSTFNGQLYQQPFMDISVNDCVAKYVDGQYVPCWESFLGFASIKTAPYDEQKGWIDKNLMVDEGPVLWPNKPYMTDGKRTNTGYYQTTLYADKDYLYLFYSNNANNGDMVPGQWNCMSVSRSPINSFGKAGTWKNYYNGSFSTDSLPVGFTKENMNAFLSVPGGKADCINLGKPLTHNSYYFNVAKINNSPYYIVAQEGSVADPNDLTKLTSWQVTLRVSKDLINWSDGYVATTANKDWGAGKYSYPTFVNKTGESVSNIDKDEFYLMGKHATGGTGYELNLMKLAINISVIPPVEKAEAVVKSYYKGFLGWDVNSSFSGFSTHLTNINNAGCYKVIKNFSQSSGFVDGNKKNLSNADYIKLLYRTILAREPDGLANGSKWWEDRLTAGDLNRDTIIDKLFEGWEPDSVCSSGKTFYSSIPVCTPICTGKSCGDSDGCSGKCVVQSCGAGKTCNAAAVCINVDHVLNTADVNKDGAVNGSDYTLFVTDYLKYRNTSVNTTRSDLNSDGKVDSVDYNNFVIEYLKARQ